MRSKDQIDAQAHRVAAALARAYGVKTGSLAEVSRRARHHVPKGLQGGLKLLLEAQRMGGNPKLLRRLDVTALDRAELTLTAHLSTIDRKAERRAALLDWGALVAFYILAVFGAMIAWLVLAGHV